MVKKWEALTNLVLHQSDGAGLVELDILCEKALVVVSAKKGEIILFSAGKKWVGGSCGWEIGEGLEEGKRERMAESAKKRGPRRWRLGASAMAFPLGGKGESALGAFLVFATEGKSFTGDDFEAGAAVAAVILEKIRLSKVRGLLESKFATASLAGIGASGIESEQMMTKEPDRVARLLAKGFCAELFRCGFGPKQMLSAGIEVIGQATRQSFAKKKK